MGLLGARADNVHLLPPDQFQVKDSVFVPSHYVTQMVTGHWSFRDRLYNLGLVDDPRCICPLGEMETPEHILYECTKYQS